MAELRQALEDDGYTDVKTYIQSGNVVLTHKPAPDAKFAAALERRITALAGYDVPLTLRSETEMRSVVKRNPFDVSDPTKLVVWFLNDKPPATALKGLEDVDIGKEAYKLSGRELYLSLPNGQADAILPVALAKLKVPAFRTATARNWRTVGKLLELAQSHS